MEIKETKHINKIHDPRLDPGMGGDKSSTFDEI